LKTIKVCPGLHFRDLVVKGNYNLDEQSICFLLPDIPSTVQAEQVFIEKNGLWADRLLTFAKLAGFVNVNLNNPPNIISRTARLLLAEQIISDLSLNFNYYKEIVNKREFTDSVLRVIAELKHSNFTPISFKSAVSQIGSTKLRSKINDISKIYAQYDTKLKSLNLIDDIDALRLLIEHVNKKLLDKSFPELKKLIVFGFNDFTPTQGEVLECLHKNGIKIDIYEYELSGGSQKKDISLKAFNSIVEESQDCVRKIKWLIDSENIAPSKIAIACKSSYENSLIIKEEFQNVAIEYCEDGQLSLKTSQIGRLILSVINLKLSNFKKNNLFQFLRNPYVLNYFGNGHEFYSYLADLELFFLKERITGGLSSWSKHEGLNKLRNSQKYSSSLVMLLEKIQKSFYLKNLSALNNDLLIFLEQIVFKKLKNNESIKTVSEVNAISSVYNVLSEYRFIIHKNFGEKKVENIYEYSNTVSDLLSDKRYSLTPAHEENKIKKLDFLEARGTAFDYLFVLGASENIIPNTSITDPILKNNERYELNRVYGKHIFKDNSELIQSEEDLVNLIINCSENIFISYVNKDERGRLVRPSYVLDDYNVIHKHKRLKHIDGILITEHDKFKHIFSEAIYRNTGFNSDAKKELHFITSGIRSEIRRSEKLSKLQDNEGLIKDSDYLKSINKFSVTELETYGLCPFKYFASHILKLRFAEETLDEPHPMRLGSVYHKILNELFIELSKSYGEKLDFRLINDEQLLSKLKVILESVGIENEFHWLSDFKKQLNLKSIVQRVLPAFILKEAERIREYNAKGFFPSEFEKELTLRLESSTIEAKADRIDLSDDQAVVIDYKLRSISSRAFCDYRNLQLPLYLNSYSTKKIGRYAGYYRSIEYPDKEKGKNIDDKDYDKQLEQSLEFAKLYIDKINAGIFPPCPQQKDINFFAESFELTKEKKAPCNFCEYSDLCRAKGAVLRIEK
jgi:ATP-dependent helicase/DNAse subunit B